MHINVKLHTELIDSEKHEIDYDMVLVLHADADALQCMEGVAMYSDE